MEQGTFQNRGLTIAHVVKKIHAHLRKDNNDYNDDDDDSGGDEAFAVQQQTPSLAIYEIKRRSAPTVLTSQSSVACTVLRSGGDYSELQFRCKKGITARVGPSDCFPSNSQLCGFT
jgi:hypothetical protein